MALPAQDNFNRADSADLGTNWDVILGNGFRITSNVAYNNTGFGGGFDGAEVWVADSFDDDQYAQGTVVDDGTSSGSSGLAIRGDPTPDDYYYGYYDGGSAYLFKVINGSFTVRGTGNNWSDGDTVYIEANGTTITAKRNGSNDTSVNSPWTDSSISSGNAGLSGWDQTSIHGIDNWEGGNLGGGTTYEDALSLSKSLTVINSSVGSFLHYLTLGKNLGLTLSNVLDTTSVISLAKELNISIIGGLVSESSLSFNKELNIVFDETLTLDEYLTLDRILNISIDNLVVWEGLITLSKELNIILANVLEIELQLSIDKIADVSNLSELISGTVTLDQYSFRWRNDDGSESTATWKENENTNTSVNKQTTIRIRFLLDSSGNYDPAQFQLEYRKVGSEQWEKVE